MISSLRGKIMAHDQEGIVTVDVNGVGYEVQCSTNSLEEIILQTSAAKTDVQLLIQTFVREDAISLFGFATLAEKQMFTSLVKVNGVGPKMAIKILSGATMNQLTQMIEAGDVKALSGLPKVGKKTAEQLVLTLKGKLVMSDEAAPRKASSKPKSEVISALVNLGFRLQDVEKVVEEMPVDLDLQNGIRHGLAALTGNF